MPDDIEILMAALMDDLMFFDGVEDAVLDPDICVQKMEDIAFSLQSLSARGREAFIDLAARRADDEEHPERAAFFRALPRDIGLLDD